METKKKGKKEIKVHFNEELVTLPKAVWNGAELRDFLKVPAQNKLFLEEPGKHPDTLIAPEMTVTLKNGDKLYDLPPGIRG